MATTQREIWAKRVERWKSTDLTAKEFAAEIGVNAGTLAHWKWVLGKSSKSPGRTRTRPAQPARPSVSFAEVMPLTAIAASDQSIELVVDGVVVRVGHAFDENTLRRVLHVVRVDR